MAAVDYPALMALVEDGTLQPQRLIERTVGLEDAAAMLPAFDRATVAGMTVVDPAR
jgi:alcohol dehydrogenase